MNSACGLLNAWDLCAALCGLLPACQQPRWHWRLACPPRKQTAPCCTAVLALLQLHQLGWGGSTQVEASPRPIPGILGHKKPKEVPFDDQAITFMTSDRLLPCPALETRRLLLPVKKALPHRALAGCDPLHPAPRTTALLDVRVPAMVLSEIRQCDGWDGRGAAGGLWLDNCCSERSRDCESTQTRTNSHFAACGLCSRRQLTLQESDSRACTQVASTTRRTQYDHQCPNLEVTTRMRVFKIGRSSSLVRSGACLGNA